MVVETPLIVTLDVVSLSCYISVYVLRRLFPYFIKLDVVETCVDELQIHVSWISVLDGAVKLSCTVTDNFPLGQDTLMRTG